MTPLAIFALLSGATVLWIGAKSAKRAKEAQQADAASPSIQTFSAARAASDAMVAEMERQRRLRLLQNAAALTTLAPKSHYMLPMRQALAKYWELVSKVCVPCVQAANNAVAANDERRMALAFWSMIANGGIGVYSTANASNTRQDVLDTISLAVIASREIPLSPTDLYGVSREFIDHAYRLAPKGTSERFKEEWKRTPQDVTSQTNLLAQWAMQSSLPDRQVVQLDLDSGRGEFYWSLFGQ